MAGKPEDPTRQAASGNAVDEPSPWRPRGKPLLALAPLAALALPPAAGTDTLASFAQSTAGPERLEAPEMKDGMVDIRRRRTSDLAAACLAARGSASSWCSAYLMGVADTLTAMGSGGHKGGICNVDYGIEDLPGIFLAFARENDRFLHLDMLAGASLAFRQRWPCRG